MTRKPGASQRLNATELDLAYYEQRQRSRQWRLFLGALARELDTMTEPEETRIFLHLIGARMAEAVPLPKVELLAELEAAMNNRWSELDWGWVKLVAVEGGIRIIHGAPPTIATEDMGEAYERLVSSLLEGAYSFWLQDQGSPGNETVRISAPGVRPVELRHTR